MGELVNKQPPARPSDSPAEASSSSTPWKDRWRLLVESAHDYAIFSTDPQRRVDYWSAGAERLFQYKERQILGISADILFTPDDRQKGAPEQEMASALERGRAEDERWHMRLDGSRFFASGVMSPLRREDGTVLGFVKIARDLTERQIAQERLQAANDALEQRVRLRTAELDVVNEELRSANEELRVEMDQRHQAEALRVEAVRRIETVQEEERRRISREIHDELGQHLAALMLGLNALELRPGADKAEIKQLQALTDRIGREMHALAVQLRPTALEDLGLHGALSSYVDLWSKRTGIAVEMHAAEIAKTRLPPDMELALYRIIQEALTNIMKHAGAKIVSIIVERRRDEVLAIVEDDGKGFKPADPRSPAGGRLGFLGMNERAAQFGGHVTLESAIGQGTTVYVRIPLKP
jgi:PAS domain S-box-containing protein